MYAQSPTRGAKLADRYQILNPLGSGGMGAVYLARDLRFERRRGALKENGDRAPAAREQFRLEAEVLATLKHPHLPAVTDHFITADGRQFLVMDYVEGEDLDDRVQRLGALPELQVLTWAEQVLDALAYLHAQSPPVIHRDLKPANVRITPDGKAMLVDFGIAKQLVAGQATATVARKMGSPGYAPLEQYSGGTDQRSDVYSLGATLYFALTGQPPLEAPLLASGHALPRPRQLNPAISRRTERAVLRAMESKAGERFQSAQEMQAALQGTQPLDVKDLADALRQRTVVFVGGIIVTLALCVMAWLGWSMWSGRGTPRPTAAPVVATAVRITPTATEQIVATATEVQPTDTVPSVASTSTPAHAGSTRSTVTTASTAIPQAISPQLLMPVPGSEHQNPLTFQWSGSLSAGQVYKVTAYHLESLYTVQSELLTLPSWSTDLPAENYGEWRWRVAVLQDGKSLTTSSEEMFWFNPFPGGGDGGNDGGDGPKPEPTKRR